ncbi:hypothetical protein RRG08_025946 [Elysia crispata]|uniref:Uncharacterized protein n=1 Tax=Elysia crispata TaxID=231223 RepID=A0AAE0ZHY6_9GAST|nr:hypothetical protein RRG08_025946 [Elysia crispata]
MGRCAGSSTARCCLILSLCLYLAVINFPRPPRAECPGWLYGSGGVEVNRTTGGTHSTPLQHLVTTQGSMVAHDAKVLRSTEPLMNHWWYPLHIPPASGHHTGLYGSGGVEVNGNTGGTHSTPLPHLVTTQGSMGTHEAEVLSHHTGLYGSGGVEVNRTTGATHSTPLPHLVTTQDSMVAHDAEVLSHHTGLYGSGGVEVNRTTGGTHSTPVPHLVTTKGSMVAKVLSHHKGLYGSGGVDVNRTTGGTHSTPLPHLVITKASMVTHDAKVLRSTEPLVVTTPHPSHIWSPHRALW